MESYTAAWCHTEGPYSAFRTTLLHCVCRLSGEPPPPLVNGTRNSPSPGQPTPGVVKQDKSSGGSVDTTKTRSGPQRVRMSSGERPIGAAKGKQPNTEALCQPPLPPLVVVVVQSVCTNCPHCIVGALPPPAPSQYAVLMMEAHLGRDGTGGVSTRGLDSTRSAFPNNRHYSGPIGCVRPPPRWTWGFQGTADVRQPRPSEAQHMHMPLTSADPLPLSRDALEGKGPQRRPQERLGRRLERVAKAFGGGYCRLQMPLKSALGVRGTAAGHSLGALEVGGVTFPPSNASLPLSLSLSLSLSQPCQFMALSGGTEALHRRLTQHLRSPARRGGRRRSRNVPRCRRPTGSGAQSET